MPGAYAHITLVNLTKETERLEKIPTFPEPAIASIYRHFKFCELGAVSPDYPYLAIADDGAKAWADLMHYAKTGDTLKAGVELVRAMTGIQREKAFAWLCGFAGHVGADVTIHPVVELKVGKYADNKGEHRVCEMHQDAYIFPRLNVGEVGLSEHLDSGIWACCSPPNSGQLDGVISALWSGMLKASHPEAFAANKPDMNKWHKSFKRVVDRIEEGHKLCPMARHVAVDCGLTYPALDRLDRQYLENLRTPEGPMDYDVLFDKAIGNVTQLWRLLAGGVFNNEQTYIEKIGNWDLDTGRDEHKKYVFWQN